MIQPLRQGKVTAILQEAEQTRTFRIVAQDNEPFDFLPGQFVSLDLPIHDKPARRLRSYSISSAPQGTNEFELLISFQSGGAGTEYLFHEVKPGSLLSFRGPLGKFTLPDKLDRDLFLICTGTGIAPFRSMIRFLLHKRLPHREIYLVFGCRMRKNLLYFEEMKKMESALSGFHYLPVLSRESWEGPTGYVHLVYEKICREAAAQKGLPSEIPLAKPAFFFLCGWRNMIDDAKKRILEMGYDRNAIHQELYG